MISANTTALVLCVETAKNSLSLALGTSQCLQCSNIYLLLIGPFALAGIALIAILITSNFTVSVGTVNGLIFYANVVRTNQEICGTSSSNALSSLLCYIIFGFLLEHSLS